MIKLLICLVCGIVLGLFMIVIELFSYLARPISLSIRLAANMMAGHTLLKIMAGDAPASEGSVSIPARARVGVLRQDQFLEDDRIILDLAMMGDRSTWEALQKRSRIIDHEEGDANHLADLEETIKNHDGYTLEARTTAVLVGLGILANFVAAVRGVAA